MKKTNNFSNVLTVTLNNIVRNASFEASRIVELLNHSGKSSIEDILRCLYYLTGELDMPNPTSVVKDDEGRILTFKSYNIFDDRLEYEYERTDRRCFKTKAEADAFATKGDYDWNKSKCSSTPTDEYPFLAEWTYATTSSCGLDTWESYSVVE